MSEFREKVLTELLSRRNTSGTWEGRLSSSALSTAVAIFAMSRYDSKSLSVEISLGLEWLQENINSDGGFGDTVDSPSNISTSLLCWAAFSLRESGDVQLTLEKYLLRELGGLSPANIVKELLAIYGDDHTFSVPILTTLTLAGRLGKEKACWQKVPQLPFELSVFPARLFRLLKLEVVSYALPALISIGLVRFKNLPSIFNPLSWFRKLIQGRALKKLQSIQPENGGFLEATPLTAFVLMSLCGSGESAHVVAVKCVDFLKKSQRKNGSFPIDTHLHTWVTTLAVNALTENPQNDGLLESEKSALKKFLKSQQHRKIHPYTRAAPGGWAWSPLPGAVPDADDTAGALLALKRLSNEQESIQEAQAGIKWLLGLQNRDGGVPTFCRGWGQLPFDQSCPDITAHCLRAFCEWREKVDFDLKESIDFAIIRLTDYLRKTQRNDGSWNPLWFGNQAAKGKMNLVYGTAQVLIALSAVQDFVEDSAGLILQGKKYLEESQALNGCWGGGQGSIEETALALHALLSVDGEKEVVKRGFASLREQTSNGESFPASPIGLYFASLWYSEEMYPLVYTMAAVEKYHATCEGEKVILIGE